MTELFEIEESKSPRLAWMDRHGIITLRGKPDSWAAWIKVNGTEFDHTIGYGETEDEAVTSLVYKLGMRLWTEEGAP